MSQPGKIAALLVAKAKPAQGEPDSPRASAMRSFLDAVKADDAAAADQALADWCDLYDGYDKGGTSDTEG